MPPARRRRRTCACTSRSTPGFTASGVRPRNGATSSPGTAALQAARRIDVVGVWSHIAEASDAEDDDGAPYSSGRVADARSPPASAPGVRHLAASAASFARPEFRYDMVRRRRVLRRHPIRGRAVGRRALGAGARIARLEAEVVAVQEEGVGSTSVRSTVCRVR